MPRRKARYIDPLVLQLREIRLTRGIEQGDLALKIGVARESLCNWENGRHSPSLYWLRKWVAALELPDALQLPPTPDRSEAPAHALAA